MAGRLVKVNGSWYYLNANGSMAAGLGERWRYWYYLEASGAEKQANG